MGRTTRVCIAIDLGNMSYSFGYVCDASTIGM